MPNTTTLLASDILNQAAVLNNDANKTSYTDAVMIPYLNMALQELQEIYELNNVPVTSSASAVMDIPAGITRIRFSPTPPIMGESYLPDDLIEPQILWQRGYNNDPYVPMVRVNQLDLGLSGTEINQFYNYVWQSQEIRFQPANQINQVKMTYVKNLFTKVTSATDSLPIINAATFLQFRTAAMLAQYIGEDDVRAGNLNGGASLGLDRIVGIGTKGRQAIFIRRRPFRQGYKQRTFM